MTFRPTLWPTIFTIPALLILLGMGTWQMQRLTWKETLIDNLRTRSESAPIAWPKDVGDFESIEFQSVIVDGRFRHDREMFLLNRSLNGNPGLHIITPFVPKDGGDVILVNRGWVPFERKTPDKRADGQLDGDVKLQGIVRVFREPNMFMPDNEPHNNTWFYLDRQAMAAHAGLGPVAPIYMMAGKNANGATFPIGKQWRLDIRNNHLEYAITWYALAITLAVIYFLYHRKPEEAEQD